MRFALLSIAIMALSIAAMPCTSPGESSHEGYTPEGDDPHYEGPSGHYGDNNNHYEHNGDDNQHHGDDNTNNWCTGGEVKCCTGDNGLHPDAFKILLDLGIIGDFKCALSLLAPACGQPVCCINNGDGDYTCHNQSGLSIPILSNLENIDIDIL